MKLTLRANLGVKLSLVFSLFMTVISTVLILNSYLEEKELLMKESAARFNSIAANLAFNAEYGALTKNLESLQQVARVAMQEKDVRRVGVSAVSGQELVSLGQSTNPSYMAVHPILTSAVPLEGEAVDELYGLHGPGPAPASRAVEAQKEKVGQVSVEFDLSPIQRKLDGLRRRAVILSVIFVQLGIFMTYMIVYFMTLPLKELVQATRKVASGDLSFRVKGESGDEIGDLAASFNIMTENLRKSTVSRDYLDTILDSIADCVVVSGPEGRIDMVNKATLELSGYAEPELVGRPIDLILSLEKSAYLTKAGEAIPISVSEGTLAEENGHVKGVVYVLHDMRPIHKLQDRLLQTEKMAAVGQLAAGVSHEINNPLGVILGFAQGLVRRLTHGDPLELPLRSIEREAMRCKNLVQDLLTFSRSTRADWDPLDLNQAVEGALSLVLAQARIHNAEVTKDLSADLPRILGNKNQVQQVIINLAKNALDAMPKGGTIVVKTLLMEEKPQPWVCLKVSDTGLGIPQDVLPRIFEPFFTTKPVGQGTGLGLSLVYEIVKKHSGMLDVQSKPGFTEFSVRFPVRTGREPGSFSARPGMAPSTAPKP